MKNELLSSRVYVRSILTACFFLVSRSRTKFYMTVKVVITEPKTLQLKNNITYKGL